MSSKLIVRFITKNLAVAVANSHFTQAAAHPGSSVLFFLLEVGMWISASLFTIILKMRSSLLPLPLRECMLMRCSRVRGLLLMTMPRSRGKGAIAHAHALQQRHGGYCSCPCLTAAQARGLLSIFQQLQVFYCANFSF